MTGQISTEKFNDLICLVVSIERATARRAAIARQLEALGLRFEFVNGIDVSTNDVRQHPEFDFDKARHRYRREVLPAEMACAHAHINCYRKFLESDAKHALIFEDDAILTPAMQEFLHGGHYRCFPFLMLNHSNAWARRSGFKTFFEGIQVVRTLNAPYMCVGYCLDRASAARVLEAGVPVSGPPDWPMDISKLQVRVVEPFLVLHPPVEKTGQSMIGDRAFARRRWKSDYFTGWYWRRKWAKLTAQRIS